MAQGMFGASLRKAPAGGGAGDELPKAAPAPMWKTMSTPVKRRNSQKILAKSKTGALGASAEPAESLVVIGTGNGGVDEMNGFVDDSQVQWALCRFDIGTGSFKRQHALFFHMNGHLCSAVKRGKANEFTTEALHILRGKGKNNFHASVVVTSKEEVTTDYLLGRLSAAVTVDHGECSAGWIREQYERQIQENAKRPPPTPESIKQEEENDARKTPAAQEEPEPEKPFKKGRDALKGVTDQDGLWNWCLIGPDEKELPLVDGGDDSVDGMVAALKQREDEVLFGLLRLGFGVGRLRRVKHILIHSVGPKVGAVKRGKLSNVRPKIQEAMRVEKMANVTCMLEIHDIEDLTIEAVIDKARRAAAVDDDDIGEDKGEGAFSVTAFRAALAEERRIASEKAEAAKKAQAEAEAAKKPEVKWKASDVVELIHRPGGPLNWALFGYGSKQARITALKAPTAPGRQTLVLGSGKFSSWRRKDEACISFEALRYAVHESEGPVRLTVKRSGDLSKRVLVQYRTDGGTACPDDDYVDTSGTLDFLPDETEKEIQVDILDDDEYEDDEDFFVVCFDARCPDGGAVRLEKDKCTATVTIIDDDDPGWLKFAGDETVEVIPDTMEACVVDVVVERMEGCKGAITVRYRTEDDAAQAGPDFDVAEGILEFDNNQMSATVSVNVKARSRYECYDAFRIILSDPTAGSRFSKEKEGQPASIVQVVAIKNTDPSEASDEEDDLDSAIDAFWDDPGKARLPVGGPKPAVSPDVGQAPPPPTPERDMTPSAGSRAKSEAESPEATASNLSKRLSMLAESLDEAEGEQALAPASATRFSRRLSQHVSLLAQAQDAKEGFPNVGAFVEVKDIARAIGRMGKIVGFDSNSDLPFQIEFREGTIDAFPSAKVREARDDPDADRRQTYAEEVFNPILECLVEACLAGQPSDTRDFMQKWIAARSVGAPVPIAEESDPQLPEDDFVQATLDPLFGPLVEVVLATLPADPLPTMLRHLSGDAGADLAPLGESWMPAPAPRLAGALMKQTKPGQFQRWEVHHVEVGPAGRLSWWLSPDMAAAKDPPAGFVELKDLVVDRGEGSEMTVSLPGQDDICFDTNVGDSNVGWPGPMSSGHPLTKALNAATWVKIIEHEVARASGRPRRKTSEMSRGRHKSSCVDDM